jgi:tRNA(adenine34) deaminase
MCFGAILLSGVSREVWAYEDAMGGGASCDLSSVGPLYREAGMEVRGRVLRKESLTLFKAFFSNPDNGYWKGSFLERYTLHAL